MTNYWLPGEQVVVRSIWEESIRAAWPDRVVVDSEHLVAIYLAQGTRFKRAETRLPMGSSSLVDETWTVDTLILMAPSDSYSVLLFWDGPSRVLSRWYINLQTPFKRTPLGIDFTDHFLDIVVSADLSRWEWKDEDELSEATRLGLVSPAMAQQIRAEGERVIRHLDAANSPFNDGWEFWQPDPGWPIPELPPGWEAV